MTTSPLESDNDGAVPKPPSESGCRETHSASGSGASPCSHDYVNFKRKGRARYHCPKCDADISLECVLLAEAMIDESENQNV